MSIYRPPVSLDSRRAAGDEPIAHVPTVTRETSFISDLESVVRGIYSETRVLVNRYDDGEIVQTRLNDVVVTRQQVVSNYETTEDEVLAIQAGTNALAPVAVATAEPIAQPIESETQAYVPAEETYTYEVQGYVDTNPLNLPPASVETAPAGQVYYEPLTPQQESNLQAQYGESYTAPVYVDNYASNLEAQYGESYTDYTSTYDQQQANLSAAYDGV